MARTVGKEGADGSLHKCLLVLLLVLSSGTRIYFYLIPDYFHVILFSLKAENPAGQATCTAELIVEAPSGHEESVSPSPPVSRSPSVGTSPAPLYHTAIPPQFTRVHSSTFWF